MGTAATATKAFQPSSGCKDGRTAGRGLGWQELLSCSSGRVKAVGDPALEIYSPNPAPAGGRHAFLPTPGPEPPLSMSPFSGPSASGLPRPPLLHPRVTQHPTRLNRLYLASERKLSSRGPQCAFPEAFACAASYRDI